MLARLLFALVLSTLLAPPAGADPARKITLTARNQPLSTVLVDLKQKTGITVQRQTAADPAITVDLKDVTFWEGLDHIASAAKATVSLYDRGGQLALVDGPGKPLPVSYAGVFRTSAKKTGGELDLRTGKDSYRAILELAWEPGFRPFYLECRSSSLEVRDDKNQQRKVPDEGTSQYAVTQRYAMEFEVTLPAFPRSVSQIGLFKGTLTVLGTPRLARLDLGPLDKLAKGQKTSDDQVTVSVRNAVTSGDPWSVQVELTYPAGGPHFESYQSWLLHNELYLEGTDGKTRLTPSDMAIDRMTDNSALVTYYFKEERDTRTRRGNPGDWRVLCVTPARLIQTQVPFELKNIPLP